MKRESFGAVRPDWQKLVAQSGVVYDFTDLGDGHEPFHYWREGPYYQFTKPDIEVLEHACKAVFDLLDCAGDLIVNDPMAMLKMGIPEWAYQAVKDSWWRLDKSEASIGSVYGRFDICFGGLDHDNPALRTPMFYEFNADTPTCLVESSIQWDWFTTLKQGDNQWNAIFESLVDAWTRNMSTISEMIGHKPIVYFVCSNDEASGEDEFNTIFMQDACDQAGYETRRIYIEDVSLGDDGRFYDHTCVYDPEMVHLDVVFKLYPWEYIVKEEFGRAVMADQANLKDASGNYAGGTFWVEPPYKMIWSNKAIWALLWKYTSEGGPLASHPAREFLLPTYFDGEQPSGMSNFVHKPMLGREGANVTIVEHGTPTLAVPGIYDDGGYVIQELHVLPPFYDAQKSTTMHPMCGVWMIDGEPAGLAIRESAGLVTNNTSFFVPHVIV